MADAAAPSSAYALPPQDQMVDPAGRPALHRRVDPAKYAWALIIAALGLLWLMGGVGFRGRLA